MATFEKQHCWSILFRLFHWMYALSIVTLVITGFYIHGPWTNTMIEGSHGFPMADMRFIHFTAGYVFAAAILIRIFLYIFGNAQERIWDILPITPRNIKNLGRTILRYAYITDKHDARLGHNVLAGITYLITFIAALFMILSGFYMLFPEVGFWQSWGVAVFGSQMVGRYVHHLFMWWFIFFVLIHVYLAVWNDVKEPEGIISSIFTGDKFIHK